MHRLSNYLKEISIYLIKSKTKSGKHSENKILKLSPPEYKTNKFYCIPYGPHSSTWE